MYSNVQDPIFPAVSLTLTVISIGLYTSPAVNLYFSGLKTGAAYVLKSLTDTKLPSVFAKLISTSSSKLSRVVKDLDEGHVTTGAVTSKKRRTT